LGPGWWGESRSFESSSKDAKRKLLAGGFTGHAPCVLPSEYDIREIPEDLYLRGARPPPPAKREAGWLSGKKKPGQRRA